MLTGVPASLLANAGAVGILAIAVLGVLRGWLVPGKSLDKLLTLHAERLAQEKERGDEWKEVARLATQRADERDKQTERLLDVINSTVTVLEALRRAAEAPK
jgi:hypothetical protein